MTGSPLSARVVAFDQHGGAMRLTPVNVNLTPAELAQVEAALRARTQALKEVRVDNADELALLTREREDCEDAWTLVREICYPAW